MNPGDTFETPRPPVLFPTAQRRPGREPRRHPGPRPRVCEPLPAQRRPGREPRRHHGRVSPTVARNVALNEGRGVNPGDTRQPKLKQVGRPAPLNEGRGVNPGDTGAEYPQWAHAASLNEGRGVNPGDTATPAKYAETNRNCAVSWARRSFKATTTASGDPLGKYYTRERSHSTRQHSPRLHAVRCNRPESLEVRKWIRAPKADQVGASGFVRSEA